jgi:hypothetical protein
MAAEILNFVKANIFWIIFGMLSMVCLFVLVMLIGPVRRQLKKIKENKAARFGKIASPPVPIQRKEEPPKEEIKPKVVEENIPVVKKPAYYDIPAMPVLKIQKKETIQIPKKIVPYYEKENVNKKVLQEEILKLRKEIRSKEKENNRKSEPAEKITRRRTKKKVTKKKR